VTTFTNGGLAEQVYIIVIVVVGTARLTRLFAEDSFPPVADLRNRWIARFNDSDWALLALCGYCQAIYIAAANLAVGLLTGFHPAWLIFNTWLSLAYLAAILTSYDGGDRE
jgi:hypothetical protein